MALRCKIQRSTAAVAVCLLASTAISSPSAYAQDGDVSLNGETAVITVVGGDPGTAEAGDGGANDGGGTGWLYRCVWLNAWAGANIGLDRPSALISGTSYSVSCRTIAAPHEPHPTLDAALIVYNPADPIPGSVDSIELASVVRAQAQMRPEPLAVGLSPETRQITGVETWLWPDGSTAYREASATADGLTVTVRAIYQKTTFNVGEPGIAPIVCDTAEPWTPDVTQPTCSHTYLTEGAARTVTAESVWQYVWRDNGAQPAWTSWESIALTEQQLVDVVDLEAVISAPN